MRNIWQIIRDDVSHLFTNVMSTILMVGLIILPSMFAWYNNMACWDVFDNTGNLKVAVANSDAGYESDLLPIEINVGDKVVSGLRGNDQIDWVFTTEEDAIEGTKAGRYYAAVVIPDTFSRDMLTFYTDEMQHATIYYYVNEKKNAITPRITEAGADAISYEINAEFANTVSEAALGFADTLSQVAEDTDAEGEIAELADRMRHAADRMDQTAEVLQLYANLAVESQDLVASSASLIDNTCVQVDNIVGTAEDGRQTLTVLSADLVASVDELAGALDQNATAMEDLQWQVDQLFATASTDTQDAAAALRNEATVIDNRIAALVEVSNDLNTLANELPEFADVINQTITTVNAEIVALGDVRDSLNSAANNLEQGNTDAQALADLVKQEAAQAKADIDTMKANFEQNIKPGIQQLAADIDVLNADLGQGMADFNTIGEDLTGSVDSAAASLGTASQKVNVASGDLHNASQSLRDLSDAIDAAITSQDVDTLKQLLGTDVESMASALSAPVQVERKAVFTSENFGSSMSPIYTTLALFVGAILIMVAMKPAVSQRGEQRLRNPKPRHLYFGRFGVVALLSLCQSTLLALGNMFFLQVQVTHPALYLFCLWFSGLVFAFFIYTLVLSFENLGKGIAVLMLIVQVTGCGGSYPLQLMPGFVQKISPFLPATHVVNALRAAMMGVYQNDFWISMFYVAVFLVPALLLGLALRKPLERFMRFYVSKVEESNMME